MLTRVPKGAMRRDPTGHLHPTTSSAARGRRRKTPAKKARYESPLGRLVRRVERIDWRYKIQFTVGFALAMVITMYLLRERFRALGQWGYLGAFIVNGISSATIILPAPGGILISIMAQDFNPLLIGIAAGLGGTIGGSTAYIAGVINASSARRSRRFPWLQRLMRRFGGIIIFIFALIPLLPGDFASIAAGAVRYPVQKYLFYNGIASMIKMTAMAYLGADLLVRLEQIIPDWARSLL